MKNKVIGIISAQYLPHLGGVERYAHNMARQLVRNECRVVVITSKLFGMEPYEESDGVEIYRLPCMEFMAGRFPVVRYNKEFRQMVKVLTQIKFEAILINTNLYILCAWGAWYCSHYNVPGIFIEHGTEHMHMGNKFINYLGQIYEHILTNYIKKRCRKFYGVSQECCQWLEHFHIIANGILYNAINSEDYINIKEKFRKEYMISENSLVLSFVGRVIAEKGILKLLKAFEMVRCQLPQTYLFIAGDGELLEKLLLQKGNNVFILGKISHIDTISLLHETDIYCLPTDYPEGFPTSVLEAAACKTFIITTSSGGSKELIKDDTYGLILEENTAESIRDAILKAVDNDYREKATQLCYKEIMDNYTWNNRAAQIIDICEIK